MLHQLMKKMAPCGLIALLALSACNKKDKEAGEGADASAAEDGKDAAAEKAKTPCEKLSEQFCKETGEKSPSCASAKEAYGLLSDAACDAAIKDFKVTQGKLKELAKDCDKLIETLCAGVGPETKSCEMVKEKTKSFPPAQCTKMLTQTKEIIAQLKAEEMKNQPLSAELQKLIAASGAPEYGPADAKVTVVEFSDFECPYCSRAANVMTGLKEKYGDKVRFVFRQFPLSFHKNAQGAAEASMAANAQGKFWEFHDLMFKNQKALSTAELEGYAKTVGLDMAKFKADMESHKYADQVKSDVELGGKVAVSGTPTLFINGERAANPTDLAAVSKVVDKALGG